MSRNFRETVFYKTMIISKLIFSGDDGEVEWTLSEAGVLWLHRDHLRLDQVRGKMEHRVN